MNIIQPIVLSGSRVFVASEASNGGALLQIVKSENGFEAQVVWETKELASKFSNPVAVGGAIYGLSLGTLVCLDERSGERLWKGKRYGHGQLLAAGGVLIVGGERGSVALVAADRKAFRELASLKVFTDKTWNTPALAGRRLFLRNAGEMACVELPGR
jgi:outer membrane protein assembly factor BamB